MNEAPYWIITADVHSGNVPEAIPQREQDIYDTWQGLCKMAAEDKPCQGIIGVGDLRDKPSLQTRNVDGLNYGIRILHEKGKVLLALVGNHDMTVPNWIVAMHHPSLYDLTDPKVQTQFGINPEATLAKHYLNRKELLEWLQSIPEEKRRKTQTIFLHLALGELSAPNQKCETNLEELTNLGFGTKTQTLLFLGDIHNYGDAKRENLEAVNPGSIEMTDRNEGVNGLKSEHHPLEKPDFRKFAIKWWPKGKNQDGIQEWERFEIPCRPWYYVRIPESKDKKTKAQLEFALKAVNNWTPEKPGIIHLILPEKETTAAKALFQEAYQAGKIFHLNVETFSKEIHGSEEDEEETNLTAANWEQTKTLLPEMAEESKLSERAKELLKKLIESDRVTANIKSDVAVAWDNWKTSDTEKSTPNEEPPEENP